MCFMSGQGYVEGSTNPMAPLMSIAGSKQGLRSIGPGLVTQETVTCASCKGKGSVYVQKDKCKKCKGERVTEARKVLEIYIPRGSK